MRKRPGADLELCAPAAPVCGVDELRLHPERNDLCIELAVEDVGDHGSRCQHHYYRKDRHQTHATAP